MVSEYVALRLLLPRVVVTWFVTGSGTSASSLRNEGSPTSANPGRHDLGAVTHYPVS